MHFIVSGNLRGTVNMTLNSNILFNQFREDFQIKRVERENLKCYSTFLLDGRKCKTAKSCHCFDKNNILKFLKRCLVKGGLKRLCIGLYFKSMCSSFKPGISKHFWKGPDSEKLLLYRSFSFCCTYSTSPSRLKNSYVSNMKTHDHGCVFIKLYLQKCLQAIVC